MGLDARVAWTHRSPDVERVPGGAAGVVPEAVRPCDEVEDGVRLRAEPVVAPRADDQVGSARSLGHRLEVP